MAKRSDHMMASEEKKETYSVQDLNSILQMLEDFDATKWHAFGLALDVNPTTLGKIEANHQKNIQRCLEQSLEMWLRESENPTKEKLIEALRSAHVKEIYLANKIEKELKRNKPTSDSELIFQDEIYGQVKFHNPLTTRIIKTHQFQRLRDIKQLDYAYKVKPRAVHSRYQHSIGMCYLAKKFMKQLQRQKEPWLNITESDLLCVEIAALCYNLGHGPYSHLFNMFLAEAAKQNSQPRPWMNVAEASVKMFDYMIEDNKLMPYFQKEFKDNVTEDIAFIKELMTGIKGEQAKRRKDKGFLYEIVTNRLSGLDVALLDTIARDAAIIDLKINFQSRKYFNRVQVKRCDDGKMHICAMEDDSALYSDLFQLHHTIHRDIFFERKVRVVATLVNRILVKSSRAKMIRRGNGQRISIFDATQDMSTFSLLDDGLLHLIRHQLDCIGDKEVEELLKRLDTSDLFVPIGYVQENTEDLKHQIVQASGASEEELSVEHLIVDPIRSGFENASKQKMFYCAYDGKIKCWEATWKTPVNIQNLQAPWRIFLTKKNKGLVKKVREGLLSLIDNGTIASGDIYYEDIDIDLSPDDESSSNGGPVPHIL